MKVVFGGKYNGVCRAIRIERIPRIIRHKDY